MSRASRMSDRSLATDINDTLTAYQQLLIKRRKCPTSDRQGMVPTVRLTIDEIREITGRQRVRNAFIENLIEKLLGHGLCVDYIDGDIAMVITKPACNLPTCFESLEALEKTLITIQGQEELALESA